MLEIRNISVAYHRQVALKDLSLVAKPGEILAIIGPNGAGKTTLINAASGVLPLSKGSIHVNNQDILSLSSKNRAQTIAVVPQARSLPAAFTVFQTVLLGRTPYLGWMGKPSQEDTSKVQAALERVNLDSIAHRSIGAISGGEQQRVLLARALAQATPILMLDEPTAHLDIRYQSGFLDVVQELATEQRLTILMALHDLNLAAIYAHRILLLVEGRMIAINTPNKVLTSETLSAAYGVPVEVIPHPAYEHPLIAVPKNPRK